MLEGCSNSVTLSTSDDLLWSCLVSKWVIVIWAQLFLRLHASQDKGCYWLILLIICCDISHPHSPTLHGYCTWNCCGVVCRFCVQLFPQGNDPAMPWPFGKDPTWAPVSQEEHRSGRVEPCVGKFKVLQPPSIVKANLHLAKFSLSRPSPQNCIGEADVSQLHDVQEISQNADAEGRVLSPCPAPSPCNSQLKCRWIWEN